MLTDKENETGADAAAETPRTPRGADREAFVTRL
jgi:hypothetical protein